MIVTCPNCGARYQVPESRAGSRMRCGECQHRWVAEAETPAATPTAEPSAAPQASAPQAASPQVPVPTPEPVIEPAAEAEAAPARPRTLATIVAIVAGLALAVAAAGLWMTGDMRDRLAAIPGAGEALDRLSPQPSPLKLTIQGATTALPSGQNLLEVSGSIANPTAAAQPVPPLSASLSGPDGTAMRWTIPPPVATLAPGASASFTSTVTGFPASATTLSVRPG